MPPFDAEPGLAKFSVWKKRAKVLSSLKKFIDGYFQVVVPPEDKAEIISWVHSIPDRVQDVSGDDIVPFWNPLTLPCDEAAGANCSGAGSAVESEPEGPTALVKEKVLEFGKMTCEVTAEKREKGLVKKKKKTKKRKRTGTKGRDYFEMSQSNTYKTGARVKIVAKTWGPRWAKLHFDDVNTMVTGTIACKAYKGKNAKADWGVIWDVPNTTESVYDEHSKAQLRLARQAAAVQIVRCSKDHVMYQSVCREIVCDGCNKSIGMTKEGELCFSCPGNDCELDYCIPCGEKRWMIWPTKV